MFDAAALAEIYRREVGRCTATLVRVLGDVDLAEDAVAEAFAIAAARWPSEGVPPNPGGWITTTARNRAIDHLRRESSRTERQLAAQRLADTEGDTRVDPDFGDLDVVPDDQLRLLFLCCHPALGPDAQVALTLRLLGGLQTAEIARAFLVPEPTMAQRLVRAKRKLRDNHARYRIPPPAELPDRLGPVLATVYLVYNEGHTASSGPDLRRPDLAGEAIRLARVLVELMPDEPEPLGLLALLLLTEARQRARIADDGQLVRLADQDRSRWDQALIAEGHAAVRACLRRNQPGRYQLQAAIAAVHADAATAADTDWSQIVALYDHLYRLRPDAIVGLNRAVALAEAEGPEAGLVALAGIDLDGYHLYHATRAELLARSGEPRRAAEAYDRAIALTDNEVERRHLADRRHALAQRQPPGPEAAGQNYDRAMPDTTESARTAELATILIDARTTNRALDPLDEGLIPTSTAEAEAVDDQVAVRTGWPVRGWKIGCTSSHAQQLLGADGPFAGRVYTVLASGADLPADRVPAEPHLEGEFAFTLGADLAPTPGGHDRDAVMAAVAAVHPAIEIVGGRFADFYGTPLHCLIADAGANTLLVLGEPVPGVDLDSLPATTATMTVDGEVTGQGAGSDVLGDPVEALRWLANRLSARGLTLREGDVVTTGTATQVSSLPPGSTAIATLDGIGSASVRRPASS